MIFLRQPNLLFLKTRKTAGTSVEIALSCSAGDDDIVTPVTTEDEIVRARMGGRAPLNWGRTLAADAAFHAGTRAAIARRANGEPEAEYVMNRDEARIPSHASAAQLEALLGADVFAAAFKVTMCRHPYEQLVSQAHWRLSRPAWRAQGYTPETAFGDIIDRLLADASGSNLAYYFIGDRYIADFVIRYEQLDADLRTLEARTGLPIVAHLPLTNHKVRTDRRPAREVLTEAQKLRCQERNRPEFERFGYEP